MFWTLIVVLIVTSPMVKAHVATLLNICFFITAFPVVHELTEVKSRRILRSSSVPLQVVTVPVMSPETTLHTEVSLGAPGPTSRRASLGTGRTRSHLGMTNGTLSILCL